MPATIPILPPGNLYGSVLGSRAVPGFSLIETSYDPGLRIPEHAHERPYFCLVLQGAFTESSAGRRRDCEAATLLFHPAGEVHSDRFAAAGGRCLNVEVAPELMSALADGGGRLDEPAFSTGGAVAATAQRLYAEFLQRDGASALAVQGLGLELLAHAARAAGRPRRRSPPPWAVRAGEILRASFAAPPSLAALAAEVGVHPVHLARGFRAAHGCTIGEYVRALRLEHARRLLVAGAQPLAQIALEAGFYDQGHFCRAFKRQHGVPPSRFRRAVRPR